MRKICIVVPDSADLFLDAGIGAHPLSLARLLAVKEGHEVAVLLADDFCSAEIGRLRAHFGSRRLRFVSISDIPAGPRTRIPPCEAAAVSNRVFNFLRNASFDVVHFQDRQANGFIPIQAKRTGLALSDTALVVSMHGSSAWVREGTREWRRRPFEESALDYCERYCCEHADLLIGSGEHLFRWAEAEGWALAPERRVLPRLFEPGSLVFPGAADADPSHLAFFGRLETRTGLELFCSAVSRLLKSGPASHGVRKVTFLGRPGYAGTDLTGKRPAMDFIREFMGRWLAAGAEVKVEAELGFSQALSFLRRSGAMAVLPYLQDDFPCSALGCLECGIPFLASSAGGIPEFVAGNVLFDPDVPSLVAALRDRAGAIGKAQSLYSRGKARQDWLSLHESPPPSAARPRPELNEPKVSICVPHHNRGKLLPQLLSSLEDIDYGDFEVIVVDAGSDCAESLRVFSEMERRYRDRGWRFSRGSRGGPGATRNSAASQARGDYLLFMDDDNLACPTMVSTFVRGMRTSGADCLACHYLAFRSEDPPKPGFTPAYVFAPVGPCLEAGMLENVFGDTNFCIRKEAFWAVGGFPTDGDSERGFEDWEFLARLSLQGFDQDVVPEALFFYRDLKGSVNKVSELQESRRCVMRAYATSGKVDLAQVLEGLLIPFHLHAGSLRAPPDTHPENS